MSIWNKIYLFGGYDGHRCLLSAEVYDITTQEWTQPPEINEKRFDCVATLIRNRIHVGGCDGSTTHSSSGVFDTSTNTWSSIRKKRQKKVKLLQLVLKFTPWVLKMVLFLH